MGLSFEEMNRLNSKIYNNLSNICFEYHQKGIFLTEDDLQKAFEWFTIHFYEDKHYEENIKIKEMGMRKPTTSFNVPHMNKCISIINGEMEANFEKPGLKSEIIYEEKPGNQDTCAIEFTKPLIDANGKNYQAEAEKYLRGAKINLSKISGDPEILSAIASIANCIDYDNATFVSNQRVELVNPDVTSYSAQLVAPAAVNTGKPKIAGEEVYYGIFSDTGYGPSASTILTKIKKRVLKDCYECLTNPNNKIYRDHAFDIFATREEAASCIYNRREHEAYSSQYYRGYYRTAYKVGKCNKDGEIIMDVRDFYNPDLWEKYPSEDEIRGCIKAYNASILNRGEE